MKSIPLKEWQDFLDLSVEHLKEMLVDGTIEDWANLPRTKAISEEFQRLQGVLIGKGYRELLDGY